jgi:signal peptidase II
MTSATQIRSASFDAGVGLRFVSWAALAAAADIASKHWAVTSLAERTIVLSDWFALMLVFNTGALGGVSLGPHTWLINVLSTIATVLLVTGVVLPLARVDRRSAMAMGLIAGGATGNLASIMGEARGVPDFLAQRFGEIVVVFNIADVALWLGAATLVPITMGLVRAVRAERAAGLASPPRPAQNPM